MASRVLITTDYLKPGDEVDQYLRRLGHETVHASAPRDLVAALKGIDGALIGHDPMTEDVLTRAPSLRAIVRTGVGYDSVDVAAAAKLGISVSNLPGINANAVAEYTIGLLLVAARGLVHSAAGVAAGRWPREDGNELRGATLGLIGYGAVAQAVVPLARAFGLRLLCTTSRPDVPEAVPLDELLAASDYVSVHTALTDRTRGLLNAAAFRRMKPTAVLINTARGPIVDEHALIEAVRSGEIAGAALDVVDVEPLPVTSPLRTVEEIVVYSHLAGQSAQARRAAGIEGAAELVAALNGAPRFAIRKKH
ncbi:phosphoglycerate dehydrogenase [Cryptosporangium phraense]|uniref:Hydroxyacid dehydrogenase n=1 Tax=Cryptosporangium phraense TaxID=2593070 RepID=A0A545AGG4_9ACTN|nr:phosphoglycerate dehydrogenase [Cryptosporangium phraense]TQS40422.1 hydroxyacid dehydrogenase [Cryptosporangium phraense]